ncbi:GspE/PulE family protein [Candidatus Hamiltonella endosymbiont of Tuberolachnus salignus]|uniref:GspE/PulE family protein n=1 Tax=Candidatus Williamhamiltonella endosymbiont of Tuberolachnus salignus TaxID=3077954 RepID=UPI0030CEBC23
MKVIPLSGAHAVPDDRLPEKLNDAICLVKRDDGTLILKVALPFIDCLEVMEYELRLKENNVQFTLMPCALSDIVELKKSAESDAENEENKSTKTIQKRIIKILSDAVTQRASDVHIRLEKIVCSVYFRIDGKLAYYEEYAAEEGNRYVNCLYNTMCLHQSHASVSYSEPSDAKVREEYVHSLGLTGGRFASRPTSEGLLSVIRLITRRDRALSLNELGLTAPQEAVLERAISKPTGVIFFTGPMGSGKSTLVQVISERMTARDPGIHLATVENPVESPIKGAVQTALGPKEEWWQSVKSLMRLDINCIVIGEVRDHLSATAAIEVAQTGHYVLTTLHTTHPVDTIARLKSLQVENDLISDAALITCLVGQRLAPKLCPHCKKPYLEHKNDLLPVFQDLIEQCCQPEQVYLKNLSGCEHCEGKGVKGRVGIFEVIEVDAEFMRRYHERGKTHAYDYWYQKGGQTLCDNTLRLINEGRIDPVMAHKEVCNLDRDFLVFTEDIREKAQHHRREWSEQIKTARVSVDF